MSAAIANRNSTHLEDGTTAGIVLTHMHGHSENQLHHTGSECITAMPIITALSDDYTAPYKLCILNNC